MDVNPGDLLRKAAAGDSSAWELLVDQFGGLVWSVARAQGLDRVDAEDVFQTTWMRLAEYATRIKDPDRVGGWLAVTARNEAFRVGRMRSRTVPIGNLAEWGSNGAELVDDETPERMTLDEEQVRLDGDRYRQIWSVFELLPEHCRRLLRVLIASPPPSYAEAADALGMPVGSVGPTRLRCLRRLREALAGQGISGYRFDS
jgi:RNA polymerase sigma factor (sigma-70 family)